VTAQNHPEDGARDAGASDAGASGGLAALPLRAWLSSRGRDARRERILGNALIVAAVLLGCWTIYLGSSLPPGPPHQWSTDWTGLDNYSLTWVGLDVLETLGLAGTGALLRVGHRETQTVALLSIPLFALDAWFDVLTATTRSDMTASAVMAVATEIPTVVLLAFVAWKSRAFPAGLSDR
jgi:hypothetical protein